MLGSLGLVRGMVLLPEQCARADRGSLDAAAARTVAWFERNQRDDGRWLYRYDADTGTDLGDYNWVRHAGVLLSLEQAATAGYAAAGVVADRGFAAAFERLVPVRDGRSLDNGSPSPGGSSLLVAALAERRERTGDPVHDDVLLDLADGLLQQVQADGSVTDAVDAAGAPVPDRPTIFTTGEVAFALARTEVLFPGRGYGDATRRILHYTATDRAAREGYLPDNPEHWGAYALATVIRWPDATEARLTPHEVAWARKQQGVQSVQIRFESQRTNDWSWWRRGHQGTGAATGTMGEAFAALDRVAAVEPALAATRGWSKERLACIAGLLADRQTDAEEAAGHPDPAAAEGAWLSSGITQMDDQQHALSALLAARAQLPDDRGQLPDGGGQVPRRTPLTSSAWLVVLAAIAALNPVRIARDAPASRGATATGLGMGVIALGVVAAAGGPLLRALEVSVPTGVVAAGLVLAVTGLATALWEHRRHPAAEGTGADERLRRARAVDTLVPVTIAGMLRPELVVLAAAAGAGGRGWLLLVALAAGGAAAVGLVGPAASSARRAALLAWGVRSCAALALASGVFLIVDGVYAV
jgi:hypothetical protein